MRVPPELLAKARLRLPLSPEEVSVLVRAAVGDAASVSEESPAESLARIQGGIQVHLPALTASAVALERLGQEIPALVCAGHLEAAYAAGLAELVAGTLRESVELVNPTKERRYSAQVRWLLALAQEQWTAWDEGGRPELTASAWWPYLAAALAKTGRGAFINPEGSAALGEEPPLVTAVRLATARKAGAS